MTGPAGAAPRSRKWPIAPLPIIAFLCIIAATLLMRLAQLGNPIAGLDDQFYLLVGDRMWSGAMPYVDIWDRKPAGLFYLYAAIRALPGDGILAYQIVALAFLALTGIVVARITARTLPLHAALASGLVIVVYGALFGVGFGEAPIFYDLLTAIAGACVIRAMERPRGAPGIDAGALAAMLLCGVALTIKTSAVFESCAFGLLLMSDDRRRGLAMAQRARRAAIYLALGLAPTALTALPYLVNGGWDAFVFANFRSAFLRTGGTNIDSFGRMIAMLLLLSPVILPAAAEWRGIVRPRRDVLTAWLAAGFLSFVAIGRCYEHYALPLVTPLALLAAYGFRRRWVAVPAFALLFAVIGWYGLNTGAGARRDKADIAALAKALPASVRTGCLFVYEGPTILYHLSNACLPGRYVFPGHFTEPEEDGALERPMADILRQTLSHRPSVIVSVPDLRRGGAATPNDLILNAALRDYRPIAARNIRLYGGQRVDVVVWQRAP